MSAGGKEMAYQEELKQYTQSSFSDEDEEWSVSGMVLSTIMHWLYSFVSSAIDPIAAFLAESVPAIKFWTLLIACIIAFKWFRPVIRKWVVERRKRLGD